MKQNTILDIKNLAIAFGDNEVIHNISYTLNKNEILGIVGESGSGKSVSSLAILGLLPKNISNITSGSIIYNNKDLTQTPSKAFQKLRGNKIAMIFKAYPHEISGGQKQRVMIAMAIACKPDILIADEPTTALDVTVQKDIIHLLKALQVETKMSIIFITHDLALISEIANRVIVMYKGDIVEQGDVNTIFKNPQHNYTKALIRSRPSLETRLKTLPTIQDFLNSTISTEIVTSAQRKENHEKLYNKPPLLEVVNIEKEYITKSGWFNKPASFKAVNNVSFKLYEGETLGLVGESGCGKSTLGNAILQLDKATAGSILYNGVDITKLSKSEIRTLRKDIQIIFQDPYSSLNPRIPVGEAILEPMKVHKLYASDKERKEKVMDLLNRVGLSEDYFNRFPHEFSGGQRQRIGIARTIALQPKLIVCDESVSALDISVQAQVLNLLNELKQDFGFTYIFISHDLAVVKYMSDQLLVMNQGKIEELDDADVIYNNPKKAYTKKLIHAIPKGL